jgi:hypothetical protein
MVDATVAVVDVVRRSSIGADNPDIDPSYEGRPHMVILWLFISFIIGAFTRYALEVQVCCFSSQLAQVHRKTKRL